MKTEAAIKQTFRASRKAALKVITDDAKRCLPKGWTVHLAVGWGLTVYDQDHRTILSEYTDLPKRLPKGVRSFLMAVAVFFDLFGPENETLTSSGLK